MPEGRDLFASRPPDDFTLPRLRWLVELRWVAVVGMGLAAVVSAAGAVPGVAWEVILSVAIAGALYNGWLYRMLARPNRPLRRRAALFQAYIDMGMLTLVLWAAGGVSSPFVAYYVFHVALVGILAGPRATLIATAGAALDAGALAITGLVPALQIGVWDPRPGWDVVTELVAFGTTIAGIAYIVTHAVSELRDREKALALAHDRVGLDHQLLSTTLQELEAGLEVVAEDGKVLWRNKRAEQLVPSVPVGALWGCPAATHSCERDVTGICPVHSARDHNQPGRCRFAAQIDGVERVYEMMSFPLESGGADQARVMNLYVDRTEATLDERRLVTTERLVSLGRVAQGVAHELNTPLATIRTLAADMRAAIRALHGDDGGAPTSENRGATVADLDESAELIQDETRRLGRITQALLAGGDLVRTRIDGAVPIAAVVERARALVFAGVRGGPAVDVDEGLASIAVSADPDRLVQVLVNLLQNAYDAVRDRKDAHVALRARVEGSEVVLTVEDDGPGLANDVEHRLFEPFTTTKPPGQGTGLGLYTTYMLVRAMGGTVTLENREEGGARATVRLSASAAARLAPASRLTQRAG
jgi:signal transduction histidine kinase